LRKDDYSVYAKSGLAIFISGSKHSIFWMALRFDAEEKYNLYSYHWDFLFSFVFYTFSSIDL